MLYSVPAVALAFSAIAAVLAIGTWLWGSRRRQVAAHRWAALANMYTLSPEAFESHVAQTYEALGYKVALTPRTGDQGVDVLAEKDAERVGIQCKRTTEPASNSAVQEAYAGKAHYRCSAASVIALGGFTSAARVLARSTGVTLTDGAGYADLFHRATASRSKRPLWTIVPGRSSILTSLLCAAAAVGGMFLGVARLSFVPPPLVYATEGQGVQSVMPTNAVRRFYGAIDGRDYSNAYAPIPQIRELRPGVGERECAELAVHLVQHAADAGLGDRQRLVLAPAHLRHDALPGRCDRRVLSWIPQPLLPVERVQR